MGMYEQRVCIVWIQMYFLRQFYMLLASIAGFGV